MKKEMKVMKGNLKKGGKIGDERWEAHRLEGVVKNKAIKPIKKQKVIKIKKIIPDKNHNPNKISKVLMVEPIE